MKETHFSKGAPGPRGRSAPCPPTRASSGPGEAGEVGCERRTDED